MDVLEAREMILQTAEEAEMEKPVQRLMMSKLETDEEVIKMARAIKEMKLDHPSSLLATANLIQMGEM